MRAITAAALAAALVAALTSCAATITAHAGPASPALPVLKTRNWTGIQPAGITFPGADPIVVNSIIWKKWDTYQAEGIGVTYDNNCIPDCAHGTQTPVDTVLILSEPVDGHFTVLTEDAADASTPLVLTYGTADWPVGTANGPA